MDGRKITCCICVWLAVKATDAADNNLLRELDKFKRIGTPPNNCRPTSGSHLKMWSFVSNDTQIKEDFLIYK